LGSSERPTRLRVGKAHDRSSGCPDPPLYSGPLPAFAERGAPEAGGNALTSAGQALMGLRGFAEDQVRYVAPIWFSAPGKPFRRHSGIPSRTAGQRPSPLASPLSTSRAPSGHDPEDRRQLVGRLHPPRLPCPTAHPASRIRFARACLARHLPSSAFLTLSTACTSRRLPGLFHPGNAHGLQAFRALLFPGGPYLSRGRLLSCRSVPPRRR